MSGRDFLGFIPHRPPFLFIDEVVEATAERMVTTWRADPQADFFAGHYPDHPVMPGVLVCECAFQAGALLIARRRGESAPSGRTPVLTRITEAKFKQMVRPGQSLCVEVTLDEELGGAYFMTGRVTVEGRLVLRVTFACAFAEGDGSE